MSDEIEILIVDDHPICRRGLRQIIETDACLKVISEAENDLQALALIENLKPEVVVTEVDMPEMRGIELAKKQRKKAENFRCFPNYAQRRNFI